MLKKTIANTLFCGGGVRWCHAVVRKPFPVIPQSSLNYPEPSGKASECLENHRQMLEKILQGGGARGIERHVKKNRKILARDRINRILDPDEPFFELLMSAGMGMDYGDIASAGAILGIGKVNGVHCMIHANDSTVKGGTAYPVTVTKSLRGHEISQNLRIPSIAIVDSGGAFLPLQSEIFPDKKHGGRTFYNQAIMSSLGIPQIALVSGMCTAGAAYTPAMSDQVIMVDKIATIFLGGPPLVKAATGEIVTGEELGGAGMHCGTSGVADYFSVNESESFETLRDIVATLNIEEPLRNTDFEIPLKSSDCLDYISGLESIGKDECYSLLSTLTDGSRMLEFKRNFGNNLICGFGKLEGVLCGFLVNCGPITAPDAQKGAHFSLICDSRDIPLIFLQNSSNSWNSDCDPVTLKERAKFVQSHSVARVPKISVNVGGLSADELYTMCGPSFGAQFNFSWPGAKLAKSEPVRQEDGVVKHENAMDALYWAGRCTFDGIILPGETRATIAKCVSLCLINYEKNSMKENRLVFRM